MLTIVLVIAAYVVGSISFAVLISKTLRLPDPRAFGSKNPGATNMLRSGKRVAAAATLVGDIAKGWSVIYLMQKFTTTDIAGDISIAAAGIAVVFGHMFPVFLRFVGGKGVATTAGVLLGLDIILGGAAAAVWLIAFAFSRTSSLSALISAGAAPFIALGVFKFTIYPVAVLLLAVLIFWRHKKNIRNLILGSEHRFRNSKNSDP